jgi:hypothetical protein
MDALARKHLEERVEKEVSIILIEGAQDYLQGLSRDALLEVLEKELRFLGFYSYEDRETPVLIRDFLDWGLDNWWQKPAMRSQLTGPPSLLIEFSSESAGSLRTKSIRSFNLAPILSSISKGAPDSAEVENTKHHSFAQTD